MLQKHFPLLCLLLFTLSYLFYYPSLLLITDEQSYFNLALSLISEQPGVYLHQEFLPQYTFDLIEAEYAIGTPLLLAATIAVFGNKGVFLLSLSCFVLSYLLILKSLRHLEYDVTAIFLLFLFLPLMFITRTVMSEMPSLLLVSISLHILVTREKTRKYYWAIFLFGGLSVLFRETNAIIFGPILLFVFFASSTANKLIQVIAFLVGLSARPIANYLVYGNALHLKHGYPFSLSFLSNNLVLYAIILCMLIPGGLYLMYKYQGKLSKLFFSIIILFTTTHLCYGYDATDYSGYKMGLILNGRFFIPLIPIFVIYLSYFLIRLRPNYKVKINNLLCIGAVVAGVGSQWYLADITSHHRKVADAISDYDDKVIIFDHSLHTNIARYINPYLGNIGRTIDISRIKNKGVVDSLFDRINEAYIIQSERTETADKMIRNNDINKFIDTTFYSLNIDTILYTGDGGVISISKIKPLQ